MGTEAILLQGIAAHKKAMEQITTLGKIVKLAEPKFDVEKSLQKFDTIMQCFLLKIAISDGDLEAHEIAYIKVVCDKADILEIVKKVTNGKVDLGWEMLKMLDKDTYGKLVSFTDKICAELIKDFVLHYAVADAIFGKDLFKPIKDSMLGIMAAFAMIDGDADSFSEKMSIAQALKLFEDAWKAVVTYTNKKTSSNNTSPSTTASSPRPNSLKSKYESLKKN